MIYDNGKKNSIRDELKKITNIITNISRELKMMKSSLKKQGNEHSIKLRKLGIMNILLDKLEYNQGVHQPKSANSDGKTE